MALVGASERPGSLGRTVFENLLAGHFEGEIEAINPRHRSVLGRPSHPNLAALGKRVDLAIIATPASAVPAILADTHAQMSAAVLMSLPDMTDPAARRSWRAEVLSIAKDRAIRLVGPGRSA